MKKSYKFFRMVLDSITEHIAVIDNKGYIQFVNRSWENFGKNNSCTISDDWRGVNYIKECDKAASMGDELGGSAGNGIRSVLDGGISMFYFEYPCHSPQEKRWFMMRVTPFGIATDRYFVISHQNITERKLAEEKIANLASIDGLTNVYNRRVFNEFLNEEWRRCGRLNKNLSLAIIDIDHFKLLNDTYGHQAGDACLVKVGSILKEFANRPGDLCARYGGEEFAIIWGDTSLEQSRVLADRLLDRITGLRIPNEKSPTEKYLTASIGLTTMLPKAGSDEKEIIKKADNLLYMAKERGRNRVISE